MFWIQPDASIACVSGPLIKKKRRFALVLADFWIVTKVGPYKVRPPMAVKNSNFTTLPGKLTGCVTLIGSYGIHGRKYPS